MHNMPLIMMQARAGGIVHQVVRLAGGEAGKLLPGVPQPESPVPQFVRHGAPQIGQRAVPGRHNETLVAGARHEALDAALRVLHHDEVVLFGVVARQAIDFLIDALHLGVVVGVEGRVGGVQSVLRLAFKPAERQRGQEFYRERGYGGAVDVVELGLYGFGVCGGEVARAVDGHDDHLRRLLIIRHHIQFPGVFPFGVAEGIATGLHRINLVGFVMLAPRHRQDGRPVVGAAGAAGVFVVRHRCATVRLKVQAVGQLGKRSEQQHAVAAARFHRFPGYPVGLMGHGKKIVVVHHGLVHEAVETIVLLGEAAETDGIICLKEGIDGGDEVGDGLAQLGIAHGGRLGEVAQEGFVDLLAEGVRQVGVFIVYLPAGRHGRVCAVQYVPVGGRI